MSCEFEWPAHQQDALEKAYQILGEQFEHVVIIVAADASDDQQAKEVLFKGGHVSALGLAMFAQHNLLKSNYDPKD